GPPCYLPALHSSARSRLRRTLCLYFFFFFFSSRRRHTRLQGDWSSDVCSSDLAEPSAASALTVDEAKLGTGVENNAVVGEGTTRSEERRVGKECRSRWWTYQ